MGNRTGKDPRPAQRTTSRPKLITPVGSSYLPPPPEPVVVPTDLPLCFPPSLQLKTRLILHEAAKQFPERAQLEHLCREIVVRMTKLLCVAVRNGTLQGHDAPDQLNNLLHYVRVCNCDSDSERFRIETAVINSGEWSAMVQQLIECTEIEPESAARPKASLNDVTSILSDDYRSLQCGEEHYSLTELAGKIVKVLREATAERGSISGDEIRSKTKCGKIWDAFRRRDGRKFWSAHIAKTDQDMFTLRFDARGIHKNKTNQL